MASNPQQFPLRDPAHFVSNGLNNCLSQWEWLLSNFENIDEVLYWIRQGVNIKNFFKGFKGNFCGNSYDSLTPQRFYQKNSDSCRIDPKLVAKTLEERIVNGSLEIVGHIDNLSYEDSPICIMPLTLDKTKLRLCHDERYLNLYIEDNPFKLDTLKEVPRLVDQHDLLINTDEKSGYDHVQLSVESRKFFGVMFSGWVLRYRTLPFGFKAACYIYQKIGQYVSGYLRKFGIPVLQYIDDRLFNVSAGPRVCDTNGKIYAILQLLTSLGYTLSIHKSVISPTTSLKFLGFIIDSHDKVFKLPEDKRDTFCKLRETALSEKTIDLLTLQRLAGKCCSMAIFIPGALFYIREMNRAISVSQKSKRPVPLVGSLRVEIEYWRFLDTWEGKAQWKKESHALHRSA